MNKRICVVGAGNWGRNHIKTLRELQSLAGIVDLNPESLSEYSNIKRFTNLKEAINYGKFDGFIVATPPETHFAVAKSIIKSNNNVLVEKPFALNLKDAIELEFLSKKYNVKCMVGHIMLFHPAIIKIKQLIKNGKIGKLQYIYSNRLNLGQVRTEENVFWSLAPHDISIFQFLTESFPKSIKAYGSAFIQNMIHDSTITLLDYPENISGHIFVSWLHPFKEHRLVVIGSHGMLSLEDSLKGKPLKHYEKKITIKEKNIKKIDGPINLIDYEKKLPLKEELRFFIDFIDGGDCKVADTGHAIDVMKILEKAGQQLVQKRIK